MWPWGHLAAGYLLYSAGVHLRTRRPPDGRATVALAFGTQFPDLVDKPLAWTLGVLPNGRSLAHSLLVAVLVVALLAVLLRRYDRGPLAAAFGVGHLSHLFGDALYPALAGDYHSLGFLAWPLVPPVEYSSEAGLLAHLQLLALTPPVVFEIALTALVSGLWLYDGAPGVGVVAAVTGRVTGWVERRLSA